WRWSRPTRNSTASCPARSRSATAAGRCRCWPAGGCSCATRRRCCAWTWGTADFKTWGFFPCIRPATPLASTHPHRRAPLEGKGTVPPAPIPTTGFCTLEYLLAPVPGATPAGEGVPFGLRAEFEEARKEVNPDDFGPNDPLKPAEAKKADWKGIIRRATDTLTGTAKDLLVAARLTEALTKAHGFAGLADGMHLLLKLVEDCWDRLPPVIEDGDLEVRAGPCNWLGDEGRAARFPHSLRLVPIVRGEAGAFGWMHWRQSQDGKGTGREDFEKAVLQATREQVQGAV